MIKIAAYAILIVLVESLNTELPKLTRTSLKQKVNSIINVTIG